MITFIAIGIFLSLLLIVLIFIFLMNRRIVASSFWVNYDQQIAKRVSTSHADKLEMETFLRKEAFQNVNMVKSEQFYSDEDMLKPYQITVIYHRKTKTPLLSSRGVFDREKIIRTIEGERKFETAEELELNDQEICLFDRLAGNYNHELYAKFRKLIFAKYYAEIVRLHGKKTIFLMARSEPKEKLLTKYIRIGFTPIRQTEHNGKLHWVVKMNYRDFQRLAKRNLQLRVMVDSTKIFSKRRI